MIAALAQAGPEAGEAVPPVRLSAAFTGELIFNICKPDVRCRPDPIWE
jgi:hypothetical protein